MKLILWISLIIFIHSCTNEELIRGFEAIGTYGWEIILVCAIGSFIIGLVIGLPILMVFEFLMKIFK